MKRLIILISDVGKGSNLLAIINAVKTGKLNLEITAVVSDTENALGLQYAKKNNIPIKICANKTKLLSTLRSTKPDIIALAGWKQIIVDEVIDAFPGMILNLHPGLIPDTLDSVVKAPDGSNALWNKGLLANKAVQNFLDKNASYAGSSVHLLTHEFDFGPVLTMAFEKIRKDDTVESLYARLKRKEHKIYVDALAKLAKSKKVLIIDGGGRGSALADKYTRSKNVYQVYAIPGNDFMKHVQNIITFPKIKTTDVKKITKMAKQQDIDLVDVAQDDAVAAGLTDALKREGLTVFGPTKNAGQIEWDKAWSRNFMKYARLPIPEYKICRSEKEGIKFIKQQPESKWFVKASGLAAGKGAIFAQSNEEAVDSIHQMASFGKAGETFLIEEYLEGEEFSAFAAVNGKAFQIIGYAQDNKRVFDGDKGPNTGGMGCSSPPKIVTKAIKRQVEDIFNKTAASLIKKKRPYLGILYLGCVVSIKNEVKIIEFNARWGDPEAQVILPGIKNDYYSYVSNITKGNFPKLLRDNKYRIAVAVASKGYPGDYSKVIGKEIDGFDELNNKVKVFGAGMEKVENRWVVSGGRLFYVLGEGTNVAQARKIAYNALSLVSRQDDNFHYRGDIGKRDIERLKHGWRKTQNLLNRR